MAKKSAKKSSVKKSSKKDTKKKSKSIKKAKISKKDLKGGTPKRKAAENKINAKAKTLVADNKKKEAFEKAMSLLPKTLTTKNLSEVIDNFPRKHKHGLVKEEVDVILEKYGVDKKAYAKEMGINTAMIIDGEIVNYDNDIEKSIRCVLEGRTKTVFEWD